MTREELRDELINLLAEDELGESDLLDVYNTYCGEINDYDSTIYYNDEDELEMVFNGQSSYYVLCRAFYGEYKLGDYFFKFDGYGNLYSFNRLSDVIDAEMIADWILDNDTDLGNSEIRELLDSYDEFEESVRMNKRTNRISESSRRKRNRRKWKDYPDIKNISSNK